MKKHKKDDKAGNDMRKDKGKKKKNQEYKQEKEQETISWY